MHAALALLLVGIVVTYLCNQFMPDPPKKILVAIGVESPSSLSSISWLLSWAVLAFSRT